MPEHRAITVRLPDRVEPTSLDLELLKATFQAIVALRFECAKEWETVLHQLEEQGWSVGWGLAWMAEARRGDDFEQASGRTLDEALNQLSQLARLDMVGHCP
ncbi:MAG TPA: hypothetical protein VLW17_10495 [Thermoanaerobaculaceae bacterium]|nr:hypothetical protein [Thermoanaerobaculaceae bacterium]